MSAWADRSSGTEAPAQTGIMGLFGDGGWQGSSGLYSAVAVAADTVVAGVFGAPASGSFSYTDMPQSNFQTCGCCSAFHGAVQSGVGSSTDGAPGQNGTLTQLADYLRAGYWASGGNIAHNWGAGATVTFNVQDLTAAERVLAREAFSLYDDVANINFTEVTSGGQIVLLNDGSGQAFANASWAVPSGLMSSSTITISSNWDSGRTALYSYKYQTYLHEIGHALGLGHQGPYNGSADWNTQRSFDNDNWRFSVMSYFSQTESNPDLGSFRFVTGPQMADISALQTMYGARSTRTGDNTYGYDGNSGASYNFSAGGLNAPSSFTIFDSGGTDTINGSGYGGSQTFDLRNGMDFASSVGGYANNVMIWGASVVENATGGAGNDRFVGNTANNVFNGGGATDEVVFAGNRSAFSFTEGNGTYGVSGGGGGADTLYSIERFIFNDGIVVDDHFGGISATGNLAIGGVTSGNTQFSGDRDWFAVQLQAGKRYVISELGSPAGAGALSDAYLRVHNILGTEISLADGEGFRAKSELGISVGTTATRFVSVEGLGADTGAYSLSIKEAAATRFQGAELKYAGFGSSAAGGSWNSANLYPRFAKDMNGDGIADLVGFGANGMFVSTNNGSSFSDATLAYAGFGASAAAGSWTNNDQYTRTIANVNGDAYQDVVGFGSEGTYVALGGGGIGASLGPTNLAISAFGAVGGWISDDYYHRELADVNGDGRADIVGFGSTSVFVSLGQASGLFATATVAMANSFGPSTAGGSWSSDNLYPRRLADVNGDARADIVGFGGNGVYVSLAQATPTPSFAPAVLALNSFGAGFLGGSWTSDDAYPRMLADINRDGRADIIGFGGNGTFFALGQADGSFGPVTADLAGFGQSAAGGGWTSNELFPRVLADMTGDSRPDIVGFGGNGTFVSSNLDFINI